MDQAYVAAYSDLAERHWWWRARRRVLATELGRLASSGKNARLLEIGCAGGANLATLAEFGEAEGLEPNSALLPQDSELRERIHAIPLDEEFQPKRPYDRVLMLDVLEHIQDRAQFLRHAARILAPDGCLILTVPAHPRLWTQHDVWNQHLLRYSRQALLQELQDAGLRVERTRFFFHGLVLPKAITRLGEQLGFHSPSLPTTPWGPVNSAAYALARTEHVLLGPLRLSFGTSLIATAHLVTDKPLGLRGLG